MKKTMLRVFALAMIAALLMMSLAACGGSTTGGSTAPQNTTETTAEPTSPSETENTAASTEEPEDTAAPANYLDVSGVDFSSPSVVIAEGDYDAMETLAKQMQNFEIDADTVVEITGEVGASMMSHTIVVPNEDHSQRTGTTFELTGDTLPEVPSDGTPIHIVGVVRMGEYFNVLVVPADQFQVLD